MADDITTVEQFCDALAIVESAGNPLAWGDFVLVDQPAVVNQERTTDATKIRLPLALGRWQVHPDRLFGEMESHLIEPLEGEPWDSLCWRVVGTIAATFLKTEDPRAIAMYWHLGHWTDPKSSDWSLDYDAKFSAALAHVKGQR
jgi:hypothetical protein